MSFQTYIFDFDGTLIDSLHCWIEAFRFGLKHFDIKATDQEIIDKVVRNWELAAKNFNIADEKLLFNLAIPKGVKLASQADLQPGVAQTLKTLKSQGKTLVIHTSARQELVDAVIRKHTLTGLFDFIAARDILERKKPDPEGVFLAQQTLGFDLKKTLYIGDSILDVETAQSAKLPVAIYHGSSNKQHYSAEEVQSWKPDFVVERFSQIATLS